MSGQLDFGEEDRSATLPRVWDLCLHLLATKVSQVTLESFIRPIQPVSLKENVVTLGVANAYAQAWLEKKAADQIRRALEFHLDTGGIEVRFIILPHEPPSEASEQKTGGASASPTRPIQPTLPLEDGPDTPTSTPTPVSPPRSGRKTTTPARASSRRAETKPTSPEPPPIPSLPLKERYIFETFLVGRSNRLAHAGAMHVAARPGEVYNPLFLYGGPGLGKTHLLHGIAHALKKTNAALRVAYVSGEYFAQHYIGALRDHATEDFRRQYREVDVWLVDDVQFIAGKEHTKEEFFHTFNTLYQSGKQIVLASDRSPRELNTMDERLRSRFQSGLIADIGAPELETRIAILQKCCQRENAQVPDDVLTYIASAIQSNIRALEGALTKLLAYSSIMGGVVSAEMAQSVLSEYFIEKPIRYRRVTVDEVVEAVAHQFGMTPTAILGPSRNKDVVLARHIAMYLCRELMPEMNTMLVGAAFGGRDHATIVYACQKLKTLMEVDTELQNLVSQLNKTLSN